MRDDDLFFRLAEVERGLANLIRVGTIAEADYGTARARVAIGEIRTAPLPWLTRRAGADRDWWAPEVGEQVVVLSPSGELAQGVILPSLYSDTYPAPASSADSRVAVMGDGLVIEHHRDTNVTRINALDSDGTLILEAKNIVIRTGEEGYFHKDHAGRADRITHTGGTAFEIDTWQNGSTAPANADQGFSPPEVLTPEE